MMRWRYLLTRALIVVLVVVLMRLALGPAIRYAAVQSLQSVTGGRVDIAQAHVDLWPPRVYFEHVHIADPSKEREDAVQIDLVDLQLNSHALLRRQWVIQRARLTGLNLNEQRETSGRLPTKIQTDSSGGAGLASRLGDLLQVKAKNKLDQITDNLETVKVSNQIRERWTAEYQTLSGRTKGLENKVRTIRDEVKGIDNPLRDLPRVQQAIAEADSIRQDLVYVRQSIDQLPAAVQQDLGRLDEARKADMNRVKQFVPVPDGEQFEFSSEMFRKVVASQIDRIRVLLDGSRKVADWTVISPEADRSRGVDMDFSDGTLAPNWLVQQAEVSGVVQVDGVEYLLSGVFGNISGEPLKVANPLTGRIKLQGRKTVRVDFARHKTPEGSWDEIKMHWPNLPVPAVALGDSSSDASIRVQPGDMELWVEMKVAGNQVQGRMLSKMQNAKIDANIPSNPYNQVLVNSLTNSLRNINQINVEARLGGNWDSMQIDVASNLSSVLSNSMKESIVLQARATEQMLAQKLDVQYRKQMSELQAWLAQQQSDVRRVLSEADSSVEQASLKLVQQLGAPDLYLGRLRGGLNLPKF